MSTAAVASGGERASTLNPNAPLFIPAAYQQVEDFSPEWWALVNTTEWFRDHWFQQHREQETFEGEDELDAANLLPDSFDLGIADDIVDEASFFAAYDVIESDGRLWKEDLKSGLGSGNDVESLMRSLNLKSPRNGGAVKPPPLEPAKYKPPQSVSPKFSPRRIIQQPR
ncbi:protein EARLY RESPONSIVE TO DEHYDRATION 15 [Iris pallida]|uniref:Protein EARLY RESPONSIVE TO DEHYDRATION 15 n=1 Tax=Iris pallida TaxID=29817 RepID=A0AAX6IG72_IRIPA|nr:protein EARLY RESPONSIVE TO DEHYDRATION 15 [Iris pallida]KAJ6852222.1 protein EARLY RESPONSIVE TO DEHYDRATION 15 [Iris pallida]